MPAPRVNGELLSRFAQQDVRVIVKVTDRQSAQCAGTTSDDKSITCILKSESFRVPNCTYVEFVGRVQTPSSIVLDSLQSHSCVPLGDNIEMDVVNQTTLLMHHPQCREFFEVTGPVAAQRA